MHNVSHKVIELFADVLMNIMVIQELSVHSKLEYLIPKDLNVNATQIVVWIRNVRMNVVSIHAGLVMHVVEVQIVSHKIIKRFVNVCLVTVEILRFHVTHLLRQINNVVPTLNVPLLNPASIYIASIHAIVDLMLIVL